MLITCSECGNVFSDKAPACPKCGCPTELARPHKEPESVSEQPPSTKPNQEQKSTPKPLSSKKEVLTPSVKSNSKQQDYIHNRANSSPLAIGIVVGAVAPFTSIIWGIRQRSWWLGLVPAGLAASLSYYAGDFSEDKTQKYFFQAIAGATAYGISRKLKIDAREKGFGITDGTEAKPEVHQKYNNPASKSSAYSVFSGISIEQSTKKIGGIALTLLAAGGGVMISRGIREAVKQNPPERDNSKSTGIATPEKENENRSLLTPWGWDISGNCLKAEKELVKEARQLHPSKFEYKYEISPGKIKSDDWSKTAYPGNFDAYQEMTWQTVYSSLTLTSSLAPQHCEVRDIWDHKSECTENELKAIPWTPAERKWVKKAVIYKDTCG